jgi:type IV secretory pathway TrbD component
VTVLRMVVGVAGVLLVVGDLYDLVRALVVPRPHTGGPVALASRRVRNMMHAAIGRMSSFATRDHLLTTLEPVVMLLRLAIWLSAGLAGFGLIIWGVGHSTFGHSFIEAGSSIFTLGFATESHPAPEVVAFLAAAFGLLIIALQIAYLPALYDSFNRRETLVTMLESRAGTPAWGPELLARHYLVGIEGNLPAFYGEWERWAADVAESHTTYPALIYMRSPHPTNSWLVGLIATLDSAALYLSLCPSAAPAEARLCVRMGFTCLRDIARAAHIPFDPDPRPDGDIALPYHDFLDAVVHLESAHLPLERSADDAWAHFKGWRINYESIAYSLTNLVFAPPGAWTGERRYPDDAAAGAPQFPRRPVDRRPDKPEGDRVDAV